MISNKYDFVKFEDATHDFQDHDQVWCVRLREWNDGDATHFDALYFPDEFNNFIIVGDDTSVAAQQRRSKAAFCYFSVILK